MKTFYKLTVFCYTVSGKISRLPYLLILRLRFMVYRVKVGKGLSVCGWIDLHKSLKSQLVIGNYVMLKSGFADNPTACSARTCLWCYRGAKESLVMIQGFSVQRL